MRYNIPANLDGEYEVYAFQQGNGCKETVFEITLGDNVKTVSFDRTSLIVEGQTRGEWVSLGTHTLSKGIGGQIRFISEEPDLHADAVLFVKK